MREDECGHSGETCCLSMRVGGHVGGYISVPPGPRSGGSERVSRTVGQLAQLGSCALLALVCLFEHVTSWTQETRFAR